MHTAGSPPVEICKLPPYFLPISTGPAKDHRHELDLPAVSSSNLPNRCKTVRCWMIFTTTTIPASSACARSFDRKILMEIFWNQTPENFCVSLRVMSLHPILHCHFFSLDCGTLQLIHAFPCCGKKRYFRKPGPVFRASDDTKITQRREEKNLFSTPFRVNEMELFPPRFSGVPGAMPSLGKEDQKWTGGRMLLFLQCRCRE